MEQQAALIDLLDEQPPAAASMQKHTGGASLEVSLSGQGPTAAQGVVTADSGTNNDDPFAGFEAVPHQPSSEATGSGSNKSQHAVPDLQQEQHQQQQQDTLSSAACLKAAAERAARTSDVLQQHSMEQGESNAKLRLLLATCAAKQVKARKLLADLSSDFSSALSHTQHSSLQQVKDLTERLQQAHQQVSAAQADAEQQRGLAAQQAELLQLRDDELVQLRAELKALRKSESRLRAELRERENRLLEAQAALSRLSAELPGSSSRQLAAVLESLSDDGSTAVSGGSPAGGGSASAAAAAVAAAAAAADAEDAADTADSEAAAAHGGAALPLTPVGQKQQQRRGTGGGLGAGVGGSMLPAGGGVSLMTPDQAAAAQYKEWLSASQQALIEAQDELLAREAEVKQLRQQIQQQRQGSSSGGGQQQGAGVDGDGGQPGQQQAEAEQQQEQQHQQQHQQQQEQLEKLHAALDAAADAAAERDRLACDLSGLRLELMQLRLQLEAADVARSEAAAALEALQQQQQQQQQEQQPEQVEEPATAAAAAERAAAAEAELVKALAAATEASAEVAALQQQLKHLQQQQQQEEAGSGSAVAPAAAAAAIGGVSEDGAPSTPYQGAVAAEGSGSSSKPVASKQASREAAAAAAAEQQQEAAAAAAGQGDAGAGAGCELLQANSRIHVLQEELQSTQDSLQLLLQLVRKGAAAAAGAALQNGGSTQAGSLAAAAAGALSTEERQQLQGLLLTADACKDTDAPDAVSTAGGKAGGAAADTRFELGALHGLLHKLECRYSTPRPLQEVMLRGREMEHLLCTALQRVHAIKKEAGGGACICPTEDDYRHPIKSAPAAAAAAGAGQQQQQHLHGFAVIDTGAAAAAAGGVTMQGAGVGVGGVGPYDSNDDALISSSDGWLQGPAVGDGADAAVYGLVSESSVSASGYSNHTASAGDGWDSWAGGAGAPSMGGGGAGGSCGGDALQGFGNGAAAAAAAAAGGGVGAAVAGGGVAAGLAPLQDEGMGYDGLDGAWWATSTINEPVTELPDFLMKRASS